MSRGPTGARWAVDAQGSDGALPAMPFPTYGTTAATSFTQYAQAPDFANSVGINVHPYYPGINFDTQAERAVIIERLIELGIRNIRGLGLFAPGDTTREDYMAKAQQWMVECMNRSEARSLSSGGPAGTGEQPLLNTVGLSNTRKESSFAFGPKFEWEIVDADGTGVNAFWPLIAGAPPAPIPLTSAPAPGSQSQVTTGTSQHHSGPVYNRNKVLGAGPPIGWTGIESIMGPNERHSTAPGSGFELGFDYGMAWIGRELMRLKRLPSLADTVLFHGADYIDYDTGRLVSGPAKMPQLPILGFGHYLGDAWQLAEDYTTRALGDVASRHQYWSGCPPQWDDNWGSMTSNNPALQPNYGSNHFFKDAFCVNGMTKNQDQPRWGRSIPMWMTEMGWYQWPQNSGATTPGNNPGWYQYAPPEVSGEFLIQNLIINYCQGFKRSHIYKITHEGHDKAVSYNLNSTANTGSLPAMGLCLTDGTRTESFHAIKNLMALVGWQQGPDEGPQPIQIPHTYTPRTTRYWCDKRETEAAGSTSTGASDNLTRDMCYKLVLRTGADEMVVFFCRPSVIWGRRNYFDSRVAGNNHATALAAGYKVETDTREVTFQIPTGWEAVEVYEPAKTAGYGVGFADVEDRDSLNYANPGQGHLGAAPITGTDTTSTPHFAVSGQTGRVRMCALTRAVKLQRTTPASTTLPIVVPSVGATPATLRTGSTTGPRLHLKGVNVWGLPDDITNNVSISGTAFHQHQYNARATVCDAVRDWGGNCIRLRAQASDYNGAPSASTDSVTKSQILDRIQNWLDACKANGNLYLVICPWDGLDGPYSGANFPAQYTNTFQFYSDVYARLGDDPMVMYETPNEPNNITMAQWQGAMQDFLSHFRETMGYTGVVVIDPINWANSGPSGAGYSDTAWSALETYDAARAGMNGKHQLVFAKHDYANNYAGSAFSASGWQAGTGGSQIKHLIWENEVGNYNGPSGNSDSWSQNIAAYLRDRFAQSQVFVGACPFLWGPWSDANAITASNNTTPTSPWGNTVKDIYFGTGSPTPSTGFQPGMVFNNDLGAIDNAQSLGAKVLRFEFTAGSSAASLDATVGYAADRGVRLLLLAAIGTPPIIDATTAANLGTWAARFGPGGTFWTGARAGQAHLAVQRIEFGNETNYNWQNPPPNNSGTSGYAARAQTYAQRFQSAYNAIQSANPGVGLLCQGMPADSQDASWIDNLFIAVPGLAAMVDGWTVHPYGTAYLSKLQNHISQLAAKGVTSTPIDITEWGLTFNISGSPAITPDNYGWSTTMTAAQAASTVNTFVNTIRSDSTIGPRLRHLMIYQTRDQDADGGTRKEGHFGVLTNTGADKGAYSPAVRTILAST